MRKACIRIWSWIQGVSVLWTTDLLVARAVLRASSDKGTFIEEYIATPAWSPVLSIESTERVLWKELRSNFALIHARLPPKHLLGNAMREEVTIWCEHALPSAIIDANVIATFVLRAVTVWLFGVHITPEEETMLVHASWEWRRQIAMKGDMDIAKVVSWMV